jgi:nucleotide-binding universal stress UspA family protein
VGAILLATDGSESARRAAVEAIDLAAARDVPPYVPCVVDQRRFDDPALGAAELATTDAEDHAALTVEEVTAMAADEVDADVVVVGEHGDHTAHFSGVGRRVSSLADREVVVVDAAT